MIHKLYSTHDTVVMIAEDDSCVSPQNSIVLGSNSNDCHHESAFVSITAIPESDKAILDPTNEP